VIEAEPFDAFDVRPSAVAVYHLGDNGTARKLLKPWSVSRLTDYADRDQTRGQGHSTNGT